MTVYRIFPAASGPGSSQSYTGPLIQGVEFEVTSGGLWLVGPAYWRADASQGAAPAWDLWQAIGAAAGVAVPGTSLLQSGGVVGQWNSVAYPTPIALSQGAPYRMQYGQANNFSQTLSYFATGGTAPAGITNGPLFCYSDTTGTAPDPFGSNQMGFATGTSDPTAGYAGGSNTAYNAWLDVFVTTVAPTGATYRLWPNYPQPLGSGINSQTTNYTLATQISLSQACAANQVAFYSPPTATILPVRASVWSLGGTRLLDNSSPTWSGAAGSGWVTTPISGNLPAGNYKVSIYALGTVEWFVAETNYWSGTGPGASGLTWGPISAPNEAGSQNGQGCYLVGDGFPVTDAGLGENYWVDLVVTPSSGPSLPSYLTMPGGYRFLPSASWPLAGADAGGSLGWFPV